VLHVVCAFIVGGILIALLSLLAERAPRSLKGIIIAFPSTITVSFAFIAFTVGSQTLIDILPGVYYSLLGTILFAFAFSSAAQWFSGKTPERKWPILYTLIIASCIWISAPLLSSRLPQKIPIALPCLVGGIIFLQPLYSRYANRFPDYPIGNETKPLEILFRGLFSGIVIAAAIIVAKSFGPFWGGILGGTYPAAFGSQLMIFQNKYPADYLPSLIKTIPIGVLSIAAYATVAAVLYPVIGITLGTVGAFTTSVFVSFILSRVRSYF